MKHLNRSDPWDLWYPISGTAMSRGSRARNGLDPEEDMKLGCDFEKVSNYLKDRKETFRHFEEERQQAFGEMVAAVLEEDYDQLWSRIKNEQYYLRECFAWMWASEAMTATLYDDWGENWTQLGAAKELVGHYMEEGDPQDESEELYDEDPAYEEAHEQLYDDGPEEWLTHVLCMEVRS